METTIEITIQDTKGAALGKQGETILGECTFSITPNGLIIIDHTDVSEQARGTGLGVRLVKSIVDYAEKHQQKIIPLCPFANAQFKKHPEWKSVLNT